MRQPQSVPHIEYQERDGRLVMLRVRHVGVVPPFPSRFSEEVYRRALSQWRTPLEDRLLTAARRLGRTAYRVVERSIIIQRCEAIAERDHQANERRWRVRRRTPRVALEERSYAFTPSTTDTRPLERRAAAALAETGNLIKEPTQDRASQPTAAPYEPSLTEALTAAWGVPSVQTRPYVHTRSR